MSTKTNQYWRLLEPEEFIKKGDEFFHEGGWWPSTNVGLRANQDNPVNSPYRRLETLPMFDSEAEQNLADYKAAYIKHTNELAQIKADEQWHPASETPTKFPVLAYWGNTGDGRLIQTKDHWHNPQTWVTSWKYFTPPPPNKSPEELAKEKCAEKYCQLPACVAAEMAWDAAMKYAKEHYESTKK